MLVVFPPGAGWKARGLCASRPSLVVIVTSSGGSLALSYSVKYIVFGLGKVRFRSYPATIVLRH
jgi:hypothetical protein